MTQPGETDGFSVSDHINLLNKYLGKRCVDAVVVNTEHISSDIVSKYSSTEQKDLVLVDYENLKDVDLISNAYAAIENGYIRHSAIKVAVDLFSYLID